jgi:hypothetical protein
VDTVVSANVPAATVAVEGGDQTGPAPFTAKLEKDKPYKLKVSAPGFVAQELEVKGGQDKVAAKLVAKQRVIAVSSDPQGATIYIENGPTGKQTPAEIPLSAAQGTKPKIHVMLRKAGYRQVDQMVEATGFVEDEARMTATVDVKLAVMVTLTPQPHPTGATTGTGNGSAKPTGTGGDSGSAVTPPPDNSGAGSAAAPPPPPPPAPTGSGGDTLP